MGEIRESWGGGMEIATLDMVVNAGLTKRHQKKGTFLSQESSERSDGERLGDP